LCRSNVLAVTHANTLELHKCVSVCMGDSKYVGPAQVCVCVCVLLCVWRVGDLGAWETHQRTA